MGQRAKRKKDRTTAKGYAVKKRNNYASAKKARKKA